MQEVKVKILCIDDDADTCEMIRVLLEYSGYEVTTVRTAAEALRLAKSVRFDLYLLDNWLTDGTGIELCRQIRSFDSASPVLFVSGAAFESDIQKAMSAGAQGYMVKPIIISELESVVDDLLKHKYEHA